MNDNSSAKQGSSSRSYRPSQEVENDEIQLGELIAILKSRKWFIVSVMAVVFIIACIYAINIPPKFEASALIQVDNKTEGMAQMLQNLDPSISSILGRSSGAMPSEIETALLSSRFILQPTIERLHLNITVRPNYFPIIGAWFAYHYQGEALAKPHWGLSRYSWGGEKIDIPRFEVPHLYLTREFKLEVGENGAYQLYAPSGELLISGKTGEVFESDTSSVVPRVKILIDKTIANPGQVFYIAAQPTDQTLKYFDQSLSITDKGSKTGGIGGGSDTGVLNLTLQGTNADLLPIILNTIVSFDINKNTSKKTAETTKTLSFLEKQSKILKSDLDKAETALSNFEAIKGIIEISAVSGALLNQIVDIEKDLELAKLKKAELLQKFTSKHPYVIAINDQQKKLQQELSFFEARVKKLPQSEQKMLSLKRDVEVRSQLYLLVLSKIQQLQMIKEGTLSDVRVLTEATESIQVPSKKVIIALGSLIFGFMLAVGIIFLRRLTSRELDDPDYVEERLGVPLYAIIPHSKKQIQLAREMKRKIPGSGPFVLADVNSKDLAIEGLRSLRTTLQFSLMEARNNVVAVLGSSPSIGKSFVSLNLAYVLADSGKKVLLFDADLRKGRIASYVMQENTPGLAEILSGEVTFEQAKRVLKPNSIDFVPTGKYPQNPSELLFGDVFQKLIDKLSPKYDVIVIDTAPILAVTDGILVAKHAGVNLLLLGSGIESLKSLEHTVKRLQKNDINVNGLIFNSTKISKHGGHGTSGYGYYNYYYYDYEKRK